MKISELNNRHINSHGGNKTFAYLCNIDTTGNIYRPSLYQKNIEIAVYTLKQIKEKLNQ